MHTNKPLISAMTPGVWDFDVLCVCGAHGEFTLDVRHCAEALYICPRCHKTFAIQPHVSVSAREVDETAVPAGQLRRWYVVADRHYQFHIRAQTEEEAIRIAMESEPTSEDDSLSNYTAEPFEDVEPSEIWQEDDDDDDN